MDFSSLISKEISKKRKKVHNKVHKSNPIPNNHKTIQKNDKSIPKIHQEPKVETKQPVEPTVEPTVEPPVSSDELTEEQLNFKLSEFNQPIDDSLTTKEKITKLKQLLRYQTKNEKYKQWLDKEAPFYQDPTKQLITLDQISNIQTNKDNLYIILRVYTKEMIKTWEGSIQSSDKEQQLLLFETKRDIVPLLYELRTGKLTDDILTSLSTIIYYIQQKDYRHANESYMKLSIGNVAWPIGVLNVGIHARSASERITGQKKTANIMIDDKTRRWITSVKRLITMAREIKDIKEFVELARRADIKSAVVKVNKKINANGKKFKQTKFKVRGSKYQYTLVVNDASKAKKLQQSLPPTLKITNL
ncbi:Pre-mRNA-splicing factor 18 [Spathaspora sp. JA1]|nr:Pre-mRNA-splicing factor 18 [Spathaspora sp. JA1]